MDVRDLAKLGTTLKIGHAALVETFARLNRFIDSHGLSGILMDCWLVGCSAG